MLLVKAQLLKLTNDPEGLEDAGAQRSDLIMSRCGVLEWVWLHVNHCTTLELANSLTKERPFVGRRVSESPITAGR